METKKKSQRERRIHTRYEASEKRKVETKEKSLEERRIHKRYEANDYLFVVHSGNIGKIKNISMGGLKCSCVYNPYLPEDSNEFDICCMPDHIYLKKIQFRKVYTGLKHLPTSSMLLTRECGIQLLYLNTSQKSKLEYLLLHHTNRTA